MGYIDQTMSTGERVLFRTRRHWVVFLPAILLLALSLWDRLALIWLTAATVAGAFGLLAYWGAEYGVTNRRVVALTGSLRHRELDIPNTGIARMEVVQRLGGSLLNYGTLKVTDTDGKVHQFWGVGQARELRWHAQNQMAAARLRNPETRRPV